jgi:sugar O-acyltransferase (sialic acid O-acetyltransferase NeuD family)
MPDPGPLVIVGAGGFGRECLDIAEELNRLGAKLEVIGFVDDSPGPFELIERRQRSCLGPVSSASVYARRFVIAIGSGQARRKIDSTLTKLGMQAIELVHPHATVGSECQLGDGVLINAGARLTTNVRLGRHVQIHANVSIGHDAELDDYVSVFPGATVSGSAQLLNGSTVGTGANVLPGVVVGANSFVGAGAVVTSDVAPGTRVVGVPARPIG